MDPLAATSSGIKELPQNLEYITVNWSNTRDIKVKSQVHKYMCYPRNLVVCEIILPSSWTGHHGSSLTVPKGTICILGAG